MKNYIALERYVHHFYPIQDDIFEELRYLVEFLSTDYRHYDKRYLEQSLSFYNSSFIYHDFIKLRENPRLLNLGMNRVN